MTEFAPNIKLTSEGYYDFPSDREIRKNLWPKESGDHPAKYNCYLVWEVMKYLTEPGQTVLDPMSGSGTTMLVAIEDRKVICIELMSKYHNMQVQVLNKLEQIKTGISGNILLLHGNCYDFLPIAADCIIFSPPYSTILQNADKQKGSWTKKDIADYSNNPWGVGNSSDFIYWQRMEKIYNKLVESAPLMACVVKDGMQNKQRRTIVGQTIQVAESVGWKLRENIIITAKSSMFLAFHKAHGEEIVEDESILIFRRA